MAGVDVFRLNLVTENIPIKNHGCRWIRELEIELDRPVAIMADLQGPKLRIGAFKDAEIELNPGDGFRLDLKEQLGSNSRVQRRDKEIFDAVKAGMDLLLDDGEFGLRVQKVSNHVIDTKVVTGGRLSNRKGVNVPGVTLGLSALSEKDKTDLEFALGLGCDWIALSFVHTKRC